MVKSPSANAGDAGSILGLGRSPGEGNGNPLWYFCLGNFMGRESWQSTGLQRGGHDLVTKQQEVSAKPRTGQQTCSVIVSNVIVSAHRSRGLHVPFLIQMA